MIQVADALEKLKANPVIRIRFKNPKEAASLMSRIREHYPSAVLQYTGTYEAKINRHSRR